MPAKTIRVSQGEGRFVGGTITETTGKDISADPILVGLGTYETAPDRSACKTPDVDNPGATSASRVVKLLVGGTYTPTSVRQWCWAWITDSPEVEPIRLDGPITLA